MSDSAGVEDTSSPVQSSALQGTDWQVPRHDTHRLFERRTRYAVGIPVINENGRIHQQLAKMHSLGLSSIADIIIADGGSTDGSVDIGVISRYGVRALLIKRGQGKLSAQLRMFFAFALRDGYEGVVILDGNNKDGVEAIPYFLASLDEGWDYVQGSRYCSGGTEERTPLLRKWAVRLVHAPLLSAAAGFRYSDTTNGFRAISWRLLLDRRLDLFRDVFDTYNLHYYLSLMAPRLGYRVKELPVARRYPAGGELPSKIKGVRANLNILILLLKTICGFYAPRRSVK